MATVNEVQVQWSASDSVSIASASNNTSDAISINAACFQAKITMKANNDGTPASGDTVDFYLLEGLGDPDGAGATEYDTVGHARFLARLDTNEEDPAQVTVWLPGPFVNAQIYAVNNSAGRAITVSALVMEQRA